MRRLGVLHGLAGLLALTAVSGSASAQSAVARPTTMPAYGRSIASNDDGTAIVTNPANLGYLPGWELRWASRYLDENALSPYQGHAFSLALPLAFGFATGLRLDFVDPPSAIASQDPQFRANYNYISWALGWRLGDAMALGTTYKHSTSETNMIDDIDSWSFGLSLRPHELIGFGFAAHDIGNPESRTGDELRASYEMAMALRPFRSRVAEIGLEGTYVDQFGGYWVPRATLGVDIPQLGRLRGEFAMSDPTEEVGPRQWLGAAVMSFAFNSLGGSMELGAGSVFGNSLGDAAKSHAWENLAIDVAFRGYREKAAAPAPTVALRLRMEDTPNSRQHVALLRRLWDIAENEPSVGAVVFELRSSPASSLAHAQELRDAVHLLRTKGRAVICHLEDGDGMGLYVCSAANRILMSPGGGLRFAGLKARYLYFKSLLDKLGIRADFVRIGAHKSAPESFTQDGSSDVARADKIDLLQQFEKMFTLGVAAGRNIEPLELRRRVARGPFIAPEAKEAGLVDELAFDDQIDEQVGKVLGGKVSVLDDKRAPWAPQTFGSTRGIALVYVDGDMVDGRSQTIPLLGMRTVGSYTIAETLKQVRESRMVGAVVLRVESGGGSALAADVIWREVELTAKVKPVIVSMGTSAASAAYYISAPSTRIFANPLTITGSIGVFYGKADVAELLKKIGVSVEVYKTAPRADAESIFRPFTPEEHVELERKVRQFYDQFLSRVSAGRKMTTVDVDKVAQGRVWTGEQAQSRGLVDELGGLRQALEYARKLGDIEDYAPIVELPVPEQSLLGRLIGAEGMQAAGTESLAAALPPELLTLAKALAPFVIHPADKPMARIEITDIGP